MTGSLIVDRHETGAQTHVLIIGVGDYPHFSDGDSFKGADDFGMRQLTSPVHSAKEIANWFAEHYQHPDAPLGTIRMLFSERGNTSFTPPGEASTNCDRANFVNVREAVRAWKAAGDEDKDNVLLFYFSGHGVSDGADMVLILDDYGEDAQAPLDGALDFSQLHRALDHCQARTQCYFIDACRVAGENIIDGSNIGRGTVVRNDPGASAGLNPTAAPIFYSTISGEAAYGQTGKMSVFSEAVVAGFNGAAADDTAGTWRVDTSQMLKLIRHYLARAEERGESLEQINESEHMVAFDLNIPPDNFHVPVVIGCKNKIENPSAILSWQNSNNMSTRTPPESEHWDVLLNVADHEFKAEISTGTDRKDQRFVRPPFREVFL